MRGRLAIVLIAIFLAISLVWLCSRAKVVEPAINGRNASAWIKALANDREEDEARKNLTDLGLAGIPYVVAGIHQASSLSTKAHSKAFAISPAMRKLLAEPFPWKFVREDLTVVLERVGKAYNNRYRDDAPLTPEIQQAVDALTLGLRDPDLNFQRLCAHALCEFGANARSSTSAFLEMFARGTAEDRTLICKAFGRIGVDASTTAPVCTALMDSLRSDDLTLKQAAIQALGGLDSAGAPAVPTLIHLLDHPHNIIRQPALRALARIGHLPAELRPRIMKFADDEDDYTRAGAALALLRIDAKDEFARKLAVDCLASGKPRTLRASTLYLILGMHGDAVIFKPQFEGLVSDEDKTVSMWARKALKEIRAENR